MKKEQWQEVAREYENKWQFPHCIGAIDGKHVVIQCPNNSGSSFYNYKGSHSIVLLAVCVANYIFHMVDFGSTGRQSDGGIFESSWIGQKFEKGELDLPYLEPLCDGPTLPYIMVGDEAFPLTNHLLRPYSRKSGTHQIKESIITN